MVRSSAFFDMCLLGMGVTIAACSVIVSNKLDSKGPGENHEPCTAPEDCNDFNLCNGVEQCTPGASSADERGCSAGTPSSPGTACDADGDTGTKDICVEGACVFAHCGDRFIDLAAGEKCDDGNASNDDGCTTGCTFTCTMDMDCNDQLFCNGIETCEPADHRCVSGAWRANNTPCTLTGGGPGTCTAGECMPPF